MRFVNAGYDLDFIARQGLSESDLDSMDIPKSKMGLRRKLISLHALDKFYQPEQEESDEEEDDEDEDDEDEEEEEEEEDEEG